jgi:hypothetical protein
MFKTVTPYVKSCIFCGKPANSKEDLFPRWILRQVQTRDPMYRQMGDAPAEITEDREVRIPCACQTCNNTWMSRMETTVKKFMGPMIEDIAISLDRQYQQNLTEWAMKCAMCNDAVDVHERFFTEAECHTFKQKRTIPDRTLVFAARFSGRSLDSNGVDFTLIEPGTETLLVRGHIYTVMVGHVVLQVLSWHPEPEHKDKIIRFKAADGPWDKLTIQIWPIEQKSVNWPPAMSLSTLVPATHYGHFRTRFKNDKGHLLLTPKASTRDKRRAKG